MSSGITDPIFCSSWTTVLIPGLAHSQKSTTLTPRTYPMCHKKAYQCLVKTARLMRQGRIKIQKCTKSRENQTVSGIVFTIITSRDKLMLVHSRLNTQRKKRIKSQMIFLPHRINLHCGVQNKHYTQTSRGVHLSEAQTVHINKSLQKNLSSLFPPNTDFVFSYLCYKQKTL